MGVCSFRIMPIPVEMVAHAIELFGRSGIRTVVECSILSENVAKCSDARLFLYDFFSFCLFFVFFRFWFVVGDFYNTLFEARR